jgi:hypothetical protein
MTHKKNDPWYRTLTGKKVDKYTLTRFVGAGNIGYVYVAQLDEVPSARPRAVKLTFDLKSGWETELRKVLALELVDGVVHFHDLGTSSLTHDGCTRLCQFTIWDYIAPGENLRDYLKRSGNVDAGFLLAVVDKVLHVLHACEAQGIVRHGDLHSGNILIGEITRAKLDDSLQPRAPIYVSDFGYGMTDGPKQPKDDYQGLAQIINEIVTYIDYGKATATHRQILHAMKNDFGKLLREGTPTERQSPFKLLETLAIIKRDAQGGAYTPSSRSETITLGLRGGDNPSVGQFQVSEMIGDRWDWWKRLFVPTVPARSKILALDIPTVVTGPRGCGKTMLFRRLSERLIVECGEIAELPTHSQFVAFYVNANDFADAFSWFPENPSPTEQSRLICYANLCILADLLTVQSARAGRFNERAHDGLLALIQQLIGTDNTHALVAGEDRLERYRAALEQIKWNFPHSTAEQPFPAYPDMAQHRWLPRFIQQARVCCPWMVGRAVMLFIDDFSTPRVSESMQRVLNRLFLQRSEHFLAKVATEAWSTFIPEDSSGKNLQDGDDYQLVDIGEEALFLSDPERLLFLRAVFSKRLEADNRVQVNKASLPALLGQLGLSKTEFARRLRTATSDQVQKPLPAATSSRRGRSRGRVQYFGEDVFANLWSGDTRTTIQLITDVIDQASDSDQATHHDREITMPVDPALQDRVFRNRGGEWLHSHTRNEPTQPHRVKAEIELLRKSTGGYSLQGTYGDHLKAVVEAFVAAANALLLGPMYTMKDGDSIRSVPRMAFRLEIVDEFRVTGLAEEVYRDLIRYGLFLRDNRGKSVRGAFVPRLYLRRLLLPFATLALSKRDSVQVTSEEFVMLLLRPDAFRAMFMAKKSKDGLGGLNLNLDFPEPNAPESPYDDTQEVQPTHLVESGDEKGES